jgi:hypothetical protein
MIYKYVKAAIQYIYENINIQTNNRIGGVMFSVLA